MPATVSIVVPTCNRLALLQRCVTAIRATVTTPYELIVVDGASTDDTRAWLAREPAILSIFEPQRAGPTKAVNRGFRLASGTVAERCVARVNDRDGFHATGPVVLRRCAARLNEGDGIHLLTSGHVSECLCMQNSDDGIDAAQRGVITACLVRDNMGDGIELDDSNLVTGNLCYGNSGHGIHVLGARNTIDSNKISFNSDGIRLASNSNVATRNDFTGDSIVDLGANNVVGPTNSTACGWANFKAD